jgi:hypothetical protein
MALRITIDVFSGRENPVIELTEKDSRKALERLRPVRKLEKGEPGLPPEPTLGYRGLIIEQTQELTRGIPKVFRLVHGDVFGARLAHRVADESFEDFVFERLNRVKNVELDQRFPQRLQEEVARFRKLREEWELSDSVLPVLRGCPCAPLYEPEWWNVPQRQPYNNCYNYAANYLTNTFAQPGRGAGAQYTSLTGASVKPAAVKDGLIDSPAANNKCPKEGHLVALVIAPGWDFHWYRKGRNGCWSHKPGGTAVTNRDNSNKLICDPRKADRGPYTEFTTFMTVMHGHILLQ